MALSARSTYSKNEATTWPIPNYWDIFALLLVFGLIIALAWSAKQMIAPFHVGESITISLEPKYLPMYAARTVLRLFIALFFSLVFTFVVGAWAAKNKYAERLIIPSIDILQSVPIYSFFTITISGFILLFQNSMLGPECASIFLVFTSQVWNMTLSFYQGVKTLPNDLREAADVFHLTSWQRFWKVEVPFSMEGLLWNMMMSMSGSWFYVTASEALTISNQNITLPGIGSYIALAITQANTYAILYAIITMLLVIFLYDQLLFRPLAHWVDRFKEEQDEDIKRPPAWLVSLFQRARLVHRFGDLFLILADFIVNFSPRAKKTPVIKPAKEKKAFLYWSSIYYFALGIFLLGMAILIIHFIITSTNLAEVRHVIMLGIYTGIRVITLIFISSLLWVPIGVFIGLRPRVAAVIQPIVQFLAAFPANLLFPIVAFLVIHYHLNVEIWVAPLMVLGTQWYILFNVIAGASALPKELKLVAANLRVRGWLWWRRLILPGIAPYFITGAITAAGGAWNASILAEVISWGAIKLEATGLGAYIARYSAQGDFTRVVLGTLIMCMMVLVINRLFWRPMYNLAVKRFQAE